MNKHSLQMQNEPSAKVINFTWGSLPVDSLDRQTVGELQMIASRRGVTVEQVMSNALDWFLATPERSSRPTHK
jgi:hypothetical protein